MPRYFGLDLHKRYVHGCEWLVDQQKGRHFRFPNTKEGWAGLLRQVDGECWVALEVTGNAFEAHDLLLPHVGRVLLANPVELKRLGSGRHTDRVDAERLAKMLALGTLPTVWVPPPAIRDIRRLVQYRDRLVRHRRRCLTQAKAVLRRHGLDGPRGTDPLRHLQPEQVEQLPEVDRVLLLSALRQRLSVEAELQAIEAELVRRVAREPAVQLLLSVTGVGTVAAATLWAYLGDPTRFPTAKQVTRYAGLDASVHQSGEDQRHGRISRNGCSLLRAVLVEAAHSVARHDCGPLGAFYRRKQRQIGPHKAVVALARKLLVVAWRMLLTGEVYRATKPALLEQKRQQLGRRLEAASNWQAVLWELWPSHGARRRRRRCAA